LAEQVVPTETKSLCQLADAFPATE